MNVIHFAGHKRRRTCSNKSIHHVHQNYRQDGAHCDGQTTRKISYQIDELFIIYVQVVSKRTDLMGSWASDWIFEYDKIMPPEIVQVVSMNFKALILISTFNKCIKPWILEISFFRRIKNSASLYPTQNLVFGKYFIYCLCFLRFEKSTDECVPFYFIVLWL